MSFSEVALWLGLGMIFGGFVLPVIIWGQAQKGGMFTSLSILGGYLAMRVGSGFRVIAEVPGVGAGGAESASGLGPLTDAIVVLGVVCIYMRSSKFQFELDKLKPQKKGLLEQSLRLVNGFRKKPPAINQPDRRTG